MSDLTDEQIENIFGGYGWAPDASSWQFTRLELLAAARDILAQSKERDEIKTLAAAFLAAYIEDQVGYWGSFDPNMDHSQRAAEKLRVALSRPPSKP